MLGHRPGLCRFGGCVAPESLARDRPGVEIWAIDGLEMSRRVGLCYAVQSLDNPTLAAMVEQLRTQSSIPSEVGAVPA